MIKTERLDIRPLEGSDWAKLREIAADFRKSKYLIYDMPLPVEEAEIRPLTERFAESGLFFAVFLRDSEKMIGYVCFHRAEDCFDLGYCFHSDFYGKGYALESCEALMEHVVAHDSVKAFTAGTAIKNLPSCRLLEKLGFVCIGTETLSFHKDEAGNDIFFEGGNYRKEI